MGQSNVEVFRSKDLREREPKVRVLRRRFASANMAGKRPWVTRVRKPILIAYWALCLAVIAAGLSALHPEFGRRLAYALGGPALELQGPFPNCAAAHAAGYYDIPVGTTAYTPSQDADLDGLACEPYPHTSASERLTRIWARWQSVPATAAR